MPNSGSQYPARSQAVPSGRALLHEIKHNGYRLIVRREGQAVYVITSGRYDSTAHFPPSLQRQSGCLRGVVDGEGVVAGEGGVADFALLHLR